MSEIIIIIIITIKDRGGVTVIKLVRLTDRGAAGTEASAEGMRMGWGLVAKVLWALCYASPEEIPELQRSRRATGNCRNIQCEDDSIMRANATRDTGSPCLGAVGASVWGVGLTGCRLLCAGKYLALLNEHEWSGPQHPAQGALRFLGSCS